DGFHQVRDQNLGDRVLVETYAVDGVTARRVAAVGPVENAVFEIELEIDGLRQVVKQDFDVGAVRWPFAVGDVEAGTENTSVAGIVPALLRPIDLSPH